MTKHPGRAYFEMRGWKVFSFQQSVWKNASQGRQGLIHAATGTGKTYAAWMAALAQAPPGDCLRVLWITPLRALAADTLTALQAPVDGLHLPWSVGERTGDTPSSVRQKQNRRMPNALVTTPESLSILLSYRNAKETFSGLRMVIVDEWHEQLGTKRGVQTELALARLRRWAPTLQTWGLSATVGNLEEGLRVLLGASHADGVIVEGLHAKRLVIDSVLPTETERFPWAGHMGRTLLPQVVQEIRQARCSLVFTNTRSQAERWYQLILEACPEWAGEIGLHHGSLDREVRTFVEGQLRLGRMRCVICTSSLDLGVDFTCVDRVLQIGSPKGVARLLQRAGRSGHQPGSTSRATCVPAHALELVEACAAREAIEKGVLESRVPVEKPFDVLAQHLVTIACGDGFDANDLLTEVRSSHAYRNLTDEEWRSVLDFVTCGGKTLSAYPDYNKLIKGSDGRWMVANEAVCRRHRMNIGTITSGSSVRVQYLTGGAVGQIDESFISGLKPNQAFVFGGKTLELVKLKEMTAYVKQAAAPGGVTPSWAGSRMPLSSLLARHVRRKLDEAESGCYRGVEMECVRPVLETQRRVSRIPVQGQLLVETLHRRGRHHVFLHPFEGLLVHEGLAALLAYRMSRAKPLSVSTMASEYSIEFTSLDPLPIADPGMFSPEHFERDLISSINAAELGRRQFREISRVAGLTFPHSPGRSKTSRQLQASGGLLFDVLSEHDPGNLLLQQARTEVLDRQLSSPSLKDALERISSGTIVYTPLERGSPLCFPILAEKLQRSAMSSETLAERIRKLQRHMEAAA